MTEELEVLNKATLYNLLKEVNSEQTDEIKREINNATKEALIKVEKNTRQISNLENKIEFLEKKVRRNNIIIFGASIDEKSNFVKETIQKLNHLLGTDIRESDINSIYLLNKTAASGNPPIVLEFISLLKKQTVFANVKKLKGTGIAISHDLSPEERKKQKVLVRHLKNAKEQNIAAKIKGNKLEINGKIYTIEDLKKLDCEVEESSEGETEVDEDIQPTQGEPISCQQKGEEVEGRNKKTVLKPATRSKKHLNKK